METLVTNKVEPYTEEEKDGYLFAVWSGLISKFNLSQEYHSKIGGTLYQAVAKGFGGEVFQPFTVKAEVMASLTENIYIFSAAKQYQQVRTLSNIINKEFVNADFDDFKKVADGIFEQYNVNYLTTEFNTAIGQAQTARRWIDIEADKKDFPLLKYVTQQDELVRKTHSTLDGIIQPIDSPFWSKYMPVNGWNCRCLTEQLQTGELTNIDEREIEDIPEIFQVNTGKKRIIFDPTKHPYFKVGRNELALKQNNFNLPIPKQ